MLISAQCSAPSVRKAKKDQTQYWEGVTNEVVSVYLKKTTT